MIDFEYIKIGEIGRTITGKTPSSKFPQDFGNEYMFITPSDNFDLKTIYQTNRYLSKIGLNKLKNKVLPVKSILVSCIGSAMGKVVVNNSTAITNQQINSIVVNSNYYDADYIYYQLKNNYKLLRTAALGSTALPMLNKTEFDELELLIHKNLPTQKRIAKVLSDLDAKIEVNNKINQELEAMAKMLYDYWFVQFDFPDDNGKPYKTSGGKMVYNEELKREIPEGWEVKELQEFAETGSGSTPLKSKKEFYANPSIPWINSGEVNQPFIVSAAKFISEAGLAGSSAKLFPRGTILMAMYGATAGQVSLIDIEACTNQAICAISPNQERFKYFIKFGLEDLYDYLVNLSTGSARDNLSQTKIRSLDFLIPTDCLMDNFHQKVNSMMEKILINLKENQKLSELRDWLLPMLMNGQVTVGSPDVERDLGEAYGESEREMATDSYREVAEERENYKN